MNKKRGQAWESLAHKHLGERTLAWLFLLSAPSNKQFAEQANALYISLGIIFCCSLMRSDGASEFQKMSALYSGATVRAWTRPDTCW